MNLSNEAVEDDDIFASVGEYDGDGADADAEEYTDDISTKQTIPTKVSLFLGGNVESNGVTQVESSLPVHSSRSLVVKGLASLGPLGFDDGIGLDFDGRDYDDEEEKEEFTNIKRKKCLETNAEQNRGSVESGIVVERSGCYSHSRLLGLEYVTLCYFQICFDVTCLITNYFKRKSTKGRDITIFTR
jgi:hypothetical protein